MMYYFGNETAYEKKMLANAQLLFPAYDPAEHHKFCNSYLSQPSGGRPTLAEDIKAKQPQGVCGRLMAWVKAIVRPCKQMKHICFLFSMSSASSQLAKRYVVCSADVPNCTVTFCNVQ
eukprot:scaffold405125_cov36-Prasinocladus_malaysianus.AAC.1